MPRYNIHSDEFLNDFLTRIFSAVFCKFRIQEIYVLLPLNNSSILDELILPHIEKNLAASQSALELGPN